MTQKILNKTYENLLAVSNGASDFFSKIAIRNFEVLTHVTTVVHQGEIIVVNVAKLVVLSGHIGHVHVVGGGANIFVFLSCENVEGDHVDFGVTVLTGLGGGHLHNLARAALKNTIKIFYHKLFLTFSDLTNFSKCKQSKNC